MFDVYKCSSNPLGLTTILPRLLCKRLLFFAALLTFLFPLVAGAGTANQAAALEANEDCIEGNYTEWLENQDQQSFFPPFPDAIGWTDKDRKVDWVEDPFPTVFGLVDYMGLIAATIETEGGPSLGTEASGSVFLCQEEGKVKVIVEIITSKALGFGQSVEDLFENGFNFSGTRTIFGNKAGDVVKGDPAAVGPAEFSLTYWPDCENLSCMDLYPYAPDMVNADPAVLPYDVRFKSTTVDENGRKMKANQHCYADEGESQTCTPEVLTIQK